MRLKPGHVTFYFEFFGDRRGEIFKIFVMLNIVLISFNASCFQFWNIIIFGVIFIFGCHL